MILPSYSIQACARYEQRRQEIEENRAAISRGATPLEVERDPAVIEKRLYRLGNTPEIARERLIGNNDMVHVQYLQQLSRMCNTVGRIVIEDGQGNEQGYGTGFMIGQGLLLTNNHVIDSRETARHAYIDFNYQVGEDNKLQTSYRFKLHESGLFITSDADNGLDFTLIEVIPAVVNGKSLDDFGWNRLFGERGKAATGEAMVVIQHPEGKVKKVALRNNNLLSFFEDFLQYETDTLQGSSGGLVCNISLEIVALHHSSVPKRDEQGNVLTTSGEVFDPSRHQDTDIDWVANEGVRVSSILREIARQQAALPPEQQRLLRKLEGQPFYPPNGSSKPVNANPVIITQPALPDTTVVTPVVTTPETPAAGAVAVTATATTAPAAEATATVVDITPPSGPDAAAAERPLTFLITTEAGPAGRYGLQLVEKHCGSAPQPLLDDKAGRHPAMQLLYYVTTRSAAHPWVLAQELCALPGITEAAPELPQLTHVDTSLDVLLKDPLPETPVKTAAAREMAIPRHQPPGKESFDYHARWNEPDKLADYQRRYGAYTNVQLSRPWNHASARFDQALALLNGELKALPRIAQLDTGYTGHPESGHLLVTEGRDFVDNDNDAADKLIGGLLRNPMHGTRTAAVICGAPTQLPHEGNNGVLPGAPVVPFRIANSVVLIRWFRQIASAVQYAIEQNFRVMTLSMGILPGHRQWEALVRYAYDSGVIWVCAAGNKVKFVVAPACYPGTICVAAANAADQPWSGTCYGWQVDISAPGEDVYIPTYNQQDEPDYAYGSGTSYAAPHVAAAAAMWLKYHEKTLETQYTQPWQTVEAFRWCLRRSARKPMALQQSDGAQLPQSWDESRYGSGLLDAAALLQTALPPAAALQHAYRQQAMEFASRDVQSGVLSMEIAYQYFNHPATAPALPAESFTQEAAWPLSPAAKAYAELMQADGPEKMMETLLNYE